MFKTIFLCVAFQALLIQNINSQCIQNIGVPNNAYNVISPNNGFSISGFNLATNGQPIINNANLVSANIAAGNLGSVANLQNFVVPNNGINVAGNSFGNSGSYGGYGTGEVSVLGELPITGTTLVTGSLPVIGTVQFNGNVPAGGLVSVVGNSPCTCNYGY